MLNYYSRQSNSGNFTKVDTPPRGGNVWIHVDEANKADANKLIKAYNLDADIIKDVFDPNELPHIEYSEDGKTLYVFLRKAWRSKTDQIKTLPLLVVVGDKDFITISQAHSNLPLNNIDIKTYSLQQSQYFLLLSLIYTIVSEYGGLVNHTSDVVHTMKYRLRSHEITNKDFYRFITIEDNIAIYKYNLRAIISLIERLRDNQDIASNHDMIEAIDDILLYVHQLLASVESSEHSVASLYNVYSTVANNTLNLRMKTLTIVMLVVTVPNIFYGMYGMNVALPFANEPWAYWFVLGITVVIMLLIVILVRRSKLL